MISSSPHNEPAFNKHLAITCDIDSTLADTRHRASTMIDTNNRAATDWLAYAQACGDDAPTDVVALLRALSPYYVIVLITSRPLGAKPETMAWLAKHRIFYDALIMDEGEYDTPTDFKVAAVEMVTASYDVILHIDDWWEVGQAVRTNLDIPAVTVRVYAPTELELAY